MLMVVPNEGKLLWLDWMVRTEDASFGDLKIGLYSNDYSPVDASVYAAFTAASFTGYVALTLERASWNAPALIGDVAYIAQDDAPQFNCTGGSPQTVYGWYLYTASSPKVMAAARFDSPRLMASGAVERLDPFRIGLKTLA